MDITDSGKKRNKAGKGVAWKWFHGVKQGKERHFFQWFYGKNRLTHPEECNIMYNCDVRRKCLCQSPGISILYIVMIDNRRIR